MIVDTPTVQAKICSLFSVALTVSPSPCLQLIHNTSTENSSSSSSQTSFPTYDDGVHVDTSYGRSCAFQDALVVEICAYSSDGDAKRSNWKPGKRCLPCLSVFGKCFCSKKPSLKPPESNQSVDCAQDGTHSASIDSFTTCKDSWSINSDGCDGDEPRPLNSSLPYSVVSRQPPPLLHRSNHTEATPSTTKNPLFFTSAISTPTLSSSTAAAAETGTGTAATGIPAFLLSPIEGGPICECLKHSSQRICDRPYNGSSPSIKSDRGSVSANGPGTQPPLLWTAKNIIRVDKPRQGCRTLPFLAQTKRVKTCLFIRSKNRRIKSFDSELIEEKEKTSNLDGIKEERKSVNGNPEWISK